MKRLFSIVATLFIALAVWAQDQVVLFDSTSVLMEESGLSHVVNHKRIRMNTANGCQNNNVIKLDYDPQSAYVEFRQVAIHRKNGTDTLLIGGGNSCTVYDYVAPARMIYWGASQKMVEVGRLNPGDEIEYTTYRKGFTYALLGGDDDSRYIPPMKGHYYDIVPFWSDCPVNEKYYEVSVLNSKNLQYEIYNDNGDNPVQKRIEKQGDRTVYMFTKKDIQPLKHEQAALADNDMQSKLLLSTAPNWQSKSVWFYNVNEEYGSFVPTEAVSKKVNQLLVGAKTEQDSISILTHWVADNIRYCGISMGEGEGFTLHNAEMNYTDRCGVCKDKAGMLVTMLRAAGFEAYAAMTMAHERIDRIPADQFNHSVCAVKHRDGHYEMLDPTWVPNVRELWSSREQQQGYLIGHPDGFDLQYTPVSAPENHYLRINATSSIDKEGNLRSKIVITAEGQCDASVRGAFGNVANVQNSLEAELIRIDPAVRFESAIQTTDPDRYLEQPVEIIYDIFIPHYATMDRKSVAFIPFSARNLFQRAMAYLRLDTEPLSRTQPFQIGHSQLVEIKETITLPNKYKQLHFPMVEGVADPAASFGCQYWMEGNTLTFAESVVLGKRIFEPQDWAPFRHAVANQKLLATTPVVLTR